MSRLADSPELRRLFRRKVGLIFRHMGDLARAGVDPVLVLGALMEMIDEGKRGNSGLRH